MENKFTLEEVLRITVRNLEEIQLPVTMAETAARIAGSIQNIQLCLDAIEKSKQEAKEQEKPEVEEDEREADAE